MFQIINQDTLDKMQKRIELVQWDNEAGHPQMSKKMKDMGMQ